MQHAADEATRDLICTRLKLAEELVFTPQVHKQETIYHIEAPSRGAFYRIGYAEYVFLSLFDGSLTVAQALTVTARRLGTKALSQEEGLRVAHWLLENQLAHDAEQGVANSTHIGTNRGSGASVMQQFNPFWIKVPLGSPESLLGALLPIFGWLFSRWATLAGLTVIVFGIGSLASHWDKFAISAQSVFAPNNWLWLGLAWIALKLIHELAHAIACKSYGGEVRDTGVIFVLLAPLAYVDVTSCWRFPSKWQRIHVAAAGMYAELVLAAVAVMLWARTDSPMVAHLLHSVIIMASVSTLLFNANPLMRFDGYYILADLTGIANLATDGSRFVNQLAARVFYGTRMSTTSTAGWQLWCVRVYGVASAAWRVLICCSLAGAAAIMFHGAGLLLAIAAILIWFGRPVVRVISGLTQRFHESRTSFMRAVGVGSAIAVSMIVVLTQFPWPGSMTAPAVVDYAELAQIRSRASGFIAHIHVDDGEAVVEGQLLLELRNEELLVEQRELELAFEQGEIRRRTALGKHNAAEAQIAERDLQAITQRLAEVQRRTNGLRVFAPVNGRVVARNLRQRLGTYVKEGAELLAVGDEQSKELVISVGQEEIDTVLPLVGEAACFRIRGRFAGRGEFQRIEPRASTDLPHPALSSAVGGPLVVKQADDMDQSLLRLAEPRFRGVIALGPSEARDLGVGQRGYAMLGLRRQTVGEVIWLRGSRWLESLLKPPTS